MTIFLTELASALCWIVYGSFFEWYWHKLWMHTPRFPKEAFHGHTVVHHGLYKGDDTYFVPESEHPQHILLKFYSLPGIVLVHLPLIYLINRYLVPHTFIGALTAITLYFVVYEYMHWNMHVPRKQFVERFRWFQFLRQHHKIHHRYHQQNFCVLFPLADWCLGTLVTEADLARRKAAREAAIERGEPHGASRGNRRASKGSIARAEASSTRNFRRFTMGRKRQERKFQKVGDLRGLQTATKDERNS